MTDKETVTEAAAAILRTNVEGRLLSLTDADVALHSGRAADLYIEERAEADMYFPILPVDEIDMREIVGEVLDSAGAYGEHYHG